MIEKSAGAVIFRQSVGKIYYLLLHYEIGHWDFPKGHIEKGEKPKEAAKREIFEETGIKDIEFIFGFKETIKYFYNKDGKTVLKTVIFYLTQTKSKDVKISYEHQDFKWLPYGKALKQLTFDNAKNILQKANSFLDKI